MALPLTPPIKPMLARTARSLPDGEGWRYEPKWDGFRTIAFRDGRDVHLQSRNGRPMNRYFPDVVEQVLELPTERLVIDGEMIVMRDGIQEFDLLSQRIHPAASRVEMLARETPAAFVAFDLLANGEQALLDLPYTERRERLCQVVQPPVQITPVTASAEDAGKWLTGTSEGVIAKEAVARYLPGERRGMTKIKRIRTADTVVRAFRFGKAEGTVGSLILGLYDDDRKLREVGHVSGFSAREKRELVGRLEPYRTYERGAGEPSRWKAEEDLVWEGLRPELVCEVAFDHVTGRRIRHGAKFRRWRTDKDPLDCHIDQLRPDR